MIKIFERWVKGEQKGSLHIMQKATLENVLSDENFVETLLSARSGEEMRVLLTKKGIVLKEEDLGTFSGILADVLEKRIIEKEMMRVAGGKRGMFVKEEIISSNPKLDEKIKNLHVWLSEIFNK